MPAPAVFAEKPNWGAAAAAAAAAAWLRLHTLYRLDQRTGKKTEKERGESRVSHGEGGEGERVRETEIG